jgi:hypothetical protein
MQMNPRARVMWAHSKEERLSLGPSNGTGGKERESTGVEWL